MPQDIPLEDGCAPSFTPPSLAHLPAPPRFVLRYATWREEEQRFYVHRANGVIAHSEEEIRDAIRDGLGTLWTAEQAEAHLVRCETYWAAIDAVREERKQDPEAKFEFDRDEERLVLELISRLETQWTTLARYAADNGKYRRLEPAIYAATIVKSWTGLDVPLRLDAGYLDLGCAIEIAKALGRIEVEAGLEYGTAWEELHNACWACTHLSEEEAKNFVSPSPSEQNPPLSSEAATSDTDGTSPAPARSKKTRAGA